MTLRFKFLLAVGLTVVFIFFGWSFYAMRNTGSWTGGSRAITFIIIGGVLGTGALTGALMWLAFYSARKGFDDAPTFEVGEPNRPPKGDDGSPTHASVDPGAR